jgi:opacity protein-like surface antigen
MYRDSLPRFVLSCALAVALVPALAAAQTSNASTSAPSAASPPAVTTPRAMASANPYRWSGFYLGFHADFTQGTGDTTFDPKPDAAQFAGLKPTTLDVSPNGTGFRISGGVDHRAGAFLFGGVADWSMPNTDDHVTQSPIIQNNGNPFPGSSSFIAAGQSTDWIVTAGVRGGLVAGNRVLVYGVGGLATGKVNYSAETNFGTTVFLSEKTQTRVGWMAGIGAEYRLARMFGIQGEWRHIDLGEESETANPIPAGGSLQMHYTWKTMANVVTVGGVIHF